LSDAIDERRGININNLDVGSEHVEKTDLRKIATSANIIELQTHTASILFVKLGARIDESDHREEVDEVDAP
jgi:hypothetical protein